MDHDNRHKRRSGVLDSEPDDLGEFCGDESSADDLRPAALDAAAAAAGAEVNEKTTKHPGGRPPGRARGLHADDSKKRAADRERHRAQAAAAAAVKVRALLHHFPFPA